MRPMIWIVIAAAMLYVAVAAIVYSQQDRLIYPAPQGIAPLPVGFDDISLKTADGLANRAWYRPAETGQSTAVYFHGNGGTLTGSAAATARLRQNGYGLLLIEYRGYGGNGGTPSEHGFYADGRAALAFLKERGVAESETVLIGNSIGGGTATQMAREITPKALILVAPFTSLPDVASATVPWLPVRLLMRDTFDNAAKVASVKAPVLVQHGSADTMIPMDHGRTLAGLAPSGTFQRFEGVGHDLIFYPEPQSAQYIWLAGLDATLPPADQTPR